VTASNVAHLPAPEPKPGKSKKKKAAAAAQEAEAGDGFVTVEHCGVTLRIPVGDNIPAAVIDAYMDGGRLAGWKALRAWVGEEQWGLLHDAGMTRGAVAELEDKLGELLGN
jgi:hypothetical protein